MLGNSAWAAAPYSFTSQPSPKPDYTDTQVVASFSGPVKIPGLRNKANVFLGFQHTDDNSATTQSTLMPTDAERHGDFSHSVNAFGQPVRPIDPTTGAAFPNNRIPQDRISSQAAALLGYYPLPNADGGGQYNFETPVLLSTRQDAIQARVIESLNNKNQVYGNVSIQRTRANTGSVFAFVDKNVVSGIDAPINWSHRFSQFYSLRLRYQFTRLATDATPYFSNPTNVSGLAGITGNNQDPANWGPPALVFASGIAGLATAQFASNRDWTHAWGAENQWSRGRHNVTFGGDVKRRRVDIVSQLNARGTFDFTGRSTGSDLADFLLGLPHASALAPEMPTSFSPRRTQTRMSRTTGGSVRRSRPTSASAGSMRRRSPRGTDASSTSTSLQSSRQRRQSSRRIPSAASPARAIRARSSASTRAASSQESASRGGPFPDPRSSSAVATACTGTRPSIRP